MKVICPEYDLRFSRQPVPFMVQKSKKKNCQAAFKGEELSYEKNPPTSPTFHYTGLLIGILIMVYYNPYILIQEIPKANHRLDVQKPYT